MSDDEQSDGPEVLDLRDLEAGKAAKALYIRMKAEASMRGQDADTEVVLLTPEEDARRPFFGQGVWRVAWEAGPYDWGVRLSNSGDLLLSKTGVLIRAFTWDNSGEYPEVVQGDEQWYLEPYHGPDVGFIRRA